MRHLGLHSDNSDFVQSFSDFPDPTISQKPMKIPKFYPLFSIIIQIHSALILTLPTPTPHSVACVNNYVYFLQSLKHASEFPGPHINSDWDNSDLINKTQFRRLPTVHLKTRIYSRNIMIKTSFKHNPVHRWPTISIQTHVLMFIEQTPL